MQPFKLFSIIYYSIIILLHGLIRVSTLLDRNSSCMIDVENSALKTTGHAQSSDTRY